MAQYNNTNKSDSGSMLGSNGSRWSHFLPPHLIQESVPSGDVWLFLYCYTFITGSDVTIHHMT